MNLRVNMSVLVTLALLLQLSSSALGGRLRLQEIYNNERADIILLRDSFTAPLSFYFNWTGSPCNGDQSRWIGVTCSKSRVVSVALQGMRLSGSLPPAALQSVWHLTFLNLSDNIIHGALPSLQGLIHLRAVSFARNRFSGSIPSEFLALPNLAQLELQDNSLNGTIPAFEQAALKVFNVSSNALEGRIPDTSVVQRFPSASFSHNLELCGKPLAKTCSPPASSDTPQGPTSTSSGSKSLRPWIVAIIVISVVVVFVSVLCFLLYLKKRSKKNNQGSYVSEAFVAKEARGSESTVEVEKDEDLAFSDKEKATFNLGDLMTSPAKLVAKGKLGETFIATLESGTEVVVKRLRGMPGVSKEEFVRHIQLLATMKHENLVEIISFYYSKEERLVVYEHVSGSNLSKLLHDGRGESGDSGEARTPLNWSARLSIVKGIARGLSHLHQSLPPHSVPHGNLKSSNVLVVLSSESKEYQTKLTDVGFQPILPPAEIHLLAIGGVPELSQGKKLTPEADVYCFGLVLLEVLTGRSPSDGEEDLAEWARPNVSKDQLTDILDLEIVGEKERHADMLKLTEIALDCVHVNAERRPTMSDLVKRIEEIRAVNKDI